MVLWHLSFDPCSFLGSMYRLLLGTVLQFLHSNRHILLIYHLPVYSLLYLQCSCVPCPHCFPASTCFGLVVSIHFQPTLCYLLMFRCMFLVRIHFLHILIFLCLFLLLWLFHLCFQWLSFVRKLNILVY
jgi:hypothetical protein